MAYDRERVQSIPKPKLKEFDLQVGDRVVYKGKVDKLHSIRFSVFDDPSYNIWQVKDISNNVFVCENRYGIRTAFRKNEYRIGEVSRYD